MSPSLLSKHFKSKNLLIIRLKKYVENNIKTTTEYKNLFGKKICLLILYYIFMKNIKRRCRKIFGIKKIKL